MPEWVSPVPAAATLAAAIYNRNYTLPRFATTTGQLALFMVWLACISYSIFAICYKLYQHFKHRFTQGFISTALTVTVTPTAKDEQTDEQTGNEAGVLSGDGENAADGGETTGFERRNCSRQCEEVIIVSTDDVNGDPHPPNCGGLRPGGNCGDVEQNNMSKVRTKPTTAKGKPIVPNASPAPLTFNKLVHEVVLFGAIMLLFYLSDYRKALPTMDRVYNADLFYFLVLLLFLVGGCFTMRPTTDKILNRDQTEEWKGWMQVMFVWYHYFAAKPWYNAIRVYIAAYVWMTGFGNFSFFWIKGDYSIWRVSKMLFRLNFLVIFVCVIVDNEYMLYYICAMHTYWFLSVYALMAILPSWNKQRYRIWLKLAIYAVCNAVIFEVPGLHMTLFRPFACLLGFHESKHEIMHEWAFRSGLDHWACFVGMLCAYNYPHLEMLIQYIESRSLSKIDRAKKLVIRFSMLAGSLIAFALWHEHIFTKPKSEYNAVHPYTSWIPIGAFIILRNLHPMLRTRYIHMFSWLGKITLETYISQLHIYLQSNAKELIGYIPGYPLLTFTVATIVYLAISYRLFQITNHLSSWLFPKNYRELWLRMMFCSIVFFTAGLVAFILNSIPKRVHV